MTTPDEKDPAPAPDGGPGKPPMTSNVFEDILFAVLAFFALCIAEPTKWVFRGTYFNKKDSGDGSHTYYEENPLNMAIGAIMALLAGVGVGYHLGWHSEALWHQYLGAGVVTAAAMAVYIWPTLYMFAVYHAFKISDKLWSHVNIDAKKPYISYKASEAERAAAKGNPPWFSQVLMFIGWVAVGLGGLAVAYETACYVQAHQAGWAWLGGLIGVVGILICIILAIVIFVGIASFFSGRFALFVLLIGLLLLYFNRGPIGELMHGLSNNLTGGGDWGSWGYVPGGLVGIITGGLSGCAAGALLLNTRIRLIAAICGVVGTYWLAGYSDAIISHIPLGPFGFLSLVLPWIGYAADMLVVVGFAFPAAHILITHTLPKLTNIFDLFDDVYGEKRGGYREFFLQVATIVGTGATIWFAPAEVTAYLGWTSVWAVWGATAVIAFLVYTLGYRILDATGSWPLGAATAGYAGSHAFAFYAAHATWPLGTLGPWAALAVTFALVFVFGFTIAYMGLRFATESWLSAALRGPLLRIHYRISHGLIDLIDELIFESAAKTYNDKTPYREVFLHMVNIVVALAVLAGSLYGGHVYGIALWLSAIAAVLLTITSYSVMGQLLLRFGTGPIGFVTGAVFGVVAGIFIHGALPVDWEGWRYAVSAVGGLVAAALWFGAFFCWGYLILRAFINIFAPEKWLRPFLIGMYDRVWMRVSSFWFNFSAKYKMFQERYRQAHERFNARYAAFKQRYNDRTKK